ncbi:M23 family metallopeptidase [Flagellimonas lutaonensis]|uniref:Peptidase M23 n=1 Tax=Flagellimonas lutaonensis TaxID=516051 RepID=A0A0D5YUD9_9FLAO|nr:M23 family metallopeptidase [Allomuricauda lutaonensis]AKA35501.1 Peptidase M23 [Allomuricauda lutaonensis]
MKNPLLFLLYLITAVSFGQENIKVYHKMVEKSIKILVDNQKYCPVTLVIDFELKNLKPVDSNNTFVVPARSDSMLLTTLVPLDLKKRSFFKYDFKYYFGDAFRTMYDSLYHYHLPFEKNKAFEVIQGYNGDFSHKNQYAIDFEMPKGTKVCAARDGVVVKVIDSNNISCPSEECKKFGNQVLIYHEDGTFADYSHIKFKGAKVKVGDDVKKGRVIAESGNVGYSDGPHLHFMVFRKEFDKDITLPTKFRTGKNGDTIEELKPHSKYMRGYD